ncbi:hypothetical protein OR622_07675, partial [Aeromonas veronii]|uniref:hypothetical protein n=1 Tax=Aeromonas veronii TaxID=654 RepID=UPI00224FD04E
IFSRIEIFSPCILKPHDWLKVINFIQVHVRFLPSLFLGMGGIIHVSDRWGENALSINMDNSATDRKV